MTNTELKQALDDYGDHLDVVIQIERGARTETIRNFTVDTTNEAGEVIVTLLAEA